MDPDVTLKALRAAVDRLDAVCANPGMWGAELAEALEAFESLDRWLSRGGALPHAWATCNHPSVRAQRRSAGPILPSPRKPQ